MRIAILFFSVTIHAATFMEQAQGLTHSLLDQIIKTPFIQELSNGTLINTKFRYYRAQDNLYNLHYADTLALLATKTETISTKVFLFSAALRTTQALIPTENRTQCPSCSAYSRYERAQVDASFEQGLAAILPCYTVYATVAEWLYNHSTANNPYGNWIKHYASPGFDNHTRQIEDISDTVFAAQGAPEQRAMLEIYRNSTQYELEFWQSAFNLGK
ncbi:MAG: hypothetical protein V4534_02745 [Myxococcota bacterium]